MITCPSTWTEPFRKLFHQKVTECINLMKREEQYNIYMFRSASCRSKAVFRSFAEARYVNRTMNGDMVPYFCAFCLAVHIGHPPEHKGVRNAVERMMEQCFQEAQQEIDATFQSSEAQREAIRRQLQAKYEAEQAANAEKSAKKKKAPATPTPVGVSAARRKAEKRAAHAYERSIMQRWEDDGGALHRRYK